MSDSLVTVSLLNFDGKRGCYFQKRSTSEAIFFFRKTIEVISSSYPIGLPCYSRKYIGQIPWLFFFIDV